MHRVRKIAYESGHVLILTFEDGAVRRVDLGPHLHGEVFEPLKDTAYFKTARLEPDLDTVVWDNGADVSPDFLYDIGTPAGQPASSVGEEPPPSERP